PASAGCSLPTGLLGSLRKGRSQALADRFPHSGDREQIERLLDGAPVVFGDQHSVMAPPRDRDRLVRLRDLVEQSVERSSRLGCRLGGHDEKSYVFTYVSSSNPVGDPTPKASLIASDTTHAHEAATSALDRHREMRVKAWMRRRPGLALTAAVALVLASLVLLVFIVSRGLPPRTIVMTTGPQGSAYQELGERYRAALAADGIRLTLEPSHGNVENLARLKDPSSGVSVGLVAGGLTTEKASPEIESLGAVAFDPIW